MTSIPDFFNGRSLFITGVTGFMGKVLLEKLLRSCPEIRMIYVLIRPKRGVDAQVRLEKVLDSKLFLSLSETNPDFKSRVFAMEGDILDENLGLSDDNIEMLRKEVSIVFHSAATVRFDEPLRLAVRMNVIGLRHMIRVCHKLNKLECLVHISTAYANCDREDISEAVYEPPMSPEKLIEATEWMDDEVLDTLTPYLIHPRPNTYTYTKAMAEYLLVQECGDIPCAIVRPSIVGPSWKEPMPGWVDNFNGPSGLLAAIGKGILRVMMGDVNAVADLIPVDICVNLIITAAWSTAIDRPSTIPVYNCTTGQTNPLTWGTLETASYEFYMKHPLNNPIRIPDPKFTNSRIYKFFHVYLDHYLPAYFLDLMAKISGQKPQLLRMQSKLWRSILTLEYFTSHQWNFSCDNTNELSTHLVQSDREDFDFDVSKIYWPTYLENYCLGVKQYALREDLAGVPKARKQMNRLVQLSRLFKVFMFIVTWKVLMTRVKVMRDLWQFLLTSVLGLAKRFQGLSQKLSISN
ncbi:hypothetical protein CAPTEDRAFT_228509 [Capitella teleta]|uniref:Fatty acyl-CoA reductase n=1 Tax=Capitella teleta TaxID=283909 RepID=R7VJ86_CAPTE|nr:hypothetical protein CAPTEDRAFT_228509 [Capitella teleta]|eukprot:ELU15810.1 hypothetical protein CAPTEDRAFT_228509 [Capitella teleta]